MKHKISKRDATKRIAKLITEINHHRYLYHVLDKEEISEAALDSLKHELQKLEEQFPDLIRPDSPSQRVGGQPIDKFEKIKHDQCMISLADVFSREELLAWEERIRKLAPSSKWNYFCELKIDGFAISLKYRKGILVQAVTRGDGRVGENVTHNVQTIHDIPLHLQKDIDCEVRGEIYMTKKVFAELNKKRARAHMPLFANPRNTAAGSIRQLDPKIAASRQLSFYGYELVTDLGQKTHEAEHQQIKALGFQIEPHSRLCQNIDDIMDFFHDWEKRRDSLENNIDGLVILVNQNHIRKSLGIVGKAPRGMIALKFPAEQATTKIIDIVVQVGRTGALTPVAHLEPVVVAGSTVSRATLHNQDEIDRKDIRIGDTVIIHKAGDIIPEVVQVLPKLRTGQEHPYHMPSTCPVCHSKVVHNTSDIVARCTNKSCTKQQHERIRHAVSKGAFDIDHCGTKIIERLISEELISDFADLFSLERGDLVSLDRFADKSADNLITAIQHAKKIPLHKFIYTLGIRHIGETASLDLARFLSQHPLKSGPYHPAINALLAIQEESLTSIEGLGEKSTTAVLQWIADTENTHILNKLFQSGIEIITENMMVSHPLSGKTFVLTGTLPTLQRAQAKELITHIGAKVASSISPHTDFLVAGESAGSKLAKAKKLGIKIINEQEFLRLVS